jgi:hemoglobin/transferrin/lactoferrin receptor protein
MIVNTKGKISVACIAVNSLFFYAQAQEDSAAKSLDEVVVTAQRTSVKKVLTPYSVESVTRKNLDDFSYRTTPEALIGLNGIFVQKTNHGGGSPFLRGLTGNQVLMLVDGIRLNNSTFRYGPNQYLNTIDPYTIHKIEVAKGTGSVQYGTDALGGVINILTKEPAFSNPDGAFQTRSAVLHGKALAKFMTGNMEKTGRAEVHYSSEKFASVAGITYRNFGDLIGGDTTGRQSPSGYNEWAFDAKTKFALADNIQLILAHQYLQQQHVPVYHKVILEDFLLNEFEPQKRMLSYARLNIKGNHSIFRQMEITASFQQNKEGRNSRKNGSNTFRKEKDQVNTAGFTVDLLSQFNNWWGSNSGIELYQDRVNSTRNDISISTNAAVSKRGLYPDGSGYGNYSLYSLHHFTFSRWVADAGIRFNTFSINITDTALGKVRITPSALVYNAALMYHLSKSGHIYASYSSGFRAPNIDDMGTLGIVDFRYEIPTADLNPEKSHHFETGYKFNGPQVSATVAGYYIKLQDLITRIKVEGDTISGYPVYRKENVERADVKGLEAQIEWEVFRQFKLSGSMAYAFGENLTKNEPLRRVPPFNGRITGAYRNKKISASVEWLFASKQNRLAQGDKDDNRIPKGGTPGWNVLNVYAGYMLTHFRFNVGAQNIFNKDYRTHGSGINGVGRSAWVNVVYQF